MGRKPKVKKEESKSVEFDGVKNETKEIKKESISPVLTAEQKARKAKLMEVMKDINKKNKDCVINFANTIEERTRISTGYETVDKLIGGGFVKGLVATIYGSKGCGKTSLAYNTIASTQKNGSIVAVVDAERSFDKERAKLFGVNLDELICIQVHQAEEALDQIIQLCKEKVVDLIVIDSISGLSPKGEMVEGKAEKQKSVADDTMALIARKLSQFFRMAVPYINDAKVSLLIIGQSRLDLGAFIKLEKLSGGHCFDTETRILTKNGLKYYNEVKIGDIIPTINLSSKTIEYKSIKNILIQKFNGKLNSFKNKHDINFLFTDNHQCLVKKYSYDKNKKIHGLLNKPIYTTIFANQKRRTYAFPISFPSGNKDYPISDDEIKFLGWVLTDGSVKIADKTKNTWEKFANKLCIYQSKLKNIEKIETILKNMKLMFTKTKRIRSDKRYPNKIFTSYVFYILKPKDIIKKYRLTEKRELPDWAFDMSDRQAKILFDAIMDGDGSRKPNNLPSYISDGNKQNLERLAGFFITHNIPVSKIKKSKKRECWYLLLKQHDYIGFMNPEKLNYNGIVWDIEVDNNLHFIERNGQMIATHNSLLHNSRIILKMRRGMNSDSPTERVDTGEINEKGKPVYENRPIGFDCVIEVEKSQVEGCTEKSVIHLPFLYTKGIEENYGK